MSGNSDESSTESEQPVPEQHPNVCSLHEDIDVELLDGIALVPRRRFLDESLQNIDELIPVTTCADPTGSR